MNKIYTYLEQTISLSADTSSRIFSSLIALIIIGLIRWIILLLVYRKTEDSRIRYQWRKISLYLASIFAIFIVGRVWFKGVQAISTYLGLLSAGVAIALKDVLTNFVGWIFIIVRRPFQVGDRIRIGDSSGDVIDQRIFQFTVMEIGDWVHADQHTGRIIHIPNGVVFNQPQVNYTQGWFDYIWDEAGVLVTFESNWKKAREILQEIGKKHGEYLGASAEKKVRMTSGRFLTFTPKLSPHVYTSIQDCGVLLTIRYLCEPRNRREVSNDISEDILTKFSEHDDIDFAYPTQRFYDNAKEGKSALKPGSDEA